MALYFIPCWHRWTILLSARPLAQVLLTVGENLPPFLVLPRRGIRGVAGFPAWRACRFSALSASIYIPRQQAAACPTPEDGALGFAYTRWRYPLRRCTPLCLVQPPRGFGSHLYPAPSRAARSRTLSGEAYGLAWVAPARAWLSFPHCGYIIACRT